MKKNRKPLQPGEKAAHRGARGGWGSSWPSGGVGNRARRKPGGAVGRPASTGEGQPTSGCPPCSEGRTERALRQHPPGQVPTDEGSLQRRERREGGDVPGRRALRHAWHTRETEHGHQEAEVEVGRRRWPSAGGWGDSPPSAPHFQTEQRKGQPPRAAGKPQSWEPFVFISKLKGPLLRV